MILKIRKIYIENKLKIKIEHVDYEGNSPIYSFTKNRKNTNNESRKIHKSFRGLSLHRKTKQNSVATISTVTQIRGQVS